MNDTKHKKWLCLLGAMTLAVGLCGSMEVPHLEADLPAELGFDSGGVVVRNTFSVAAAGERSLQIGDRIRSANSVPIMFLDQLYFFLGGFRVGDTIVMEVERRGKILHLPQRLQPRLQTSFLVANMIVGCLFWLFGMLVLFFGRLDRNVILFFFMSMSLSLVILVYGPENNFGLPGLSWLGALFSHGLYPLTVTLLLHFSLGFPAYFSTRQKRLAPLVYLPALAFSFFLVWTQLRARSTLDISDILDHVMVQQAFRLFLTLFFVLSPLLWLYRLRKARDSATRKKLKWLLFGFTAGIAPHIFLFELPRGLGGEPLLPEQVTLLFSPLAAASVVVAVVRHHFFDIDLLINRSIVYTLLSLFVAGVYLGLVAGADILLKGRLESLVGVRVGAVLLLAALFEPARRLSQRLVDRLFFRRHYDQRQALIELSRFVSRTHNMNELAAFLARLVSETLKVTRVTLFFLDAPRMQLLPLSPAGKSSDAALEAEEFLPVSPTAETSVISRSALLERRGYELAVRLLAEGRLAGLVALGPKDRLSPYSDEDMHFLEAVAAQTALAFEAARAFHQLREMNIKLEQKVFERTAQMAESNDRLVEQYLQLQRLDEMKETLTRMIVHDLRNPLATISLGTELLHQECSSLSADAARTIETIDSAARHMQDMIQSMLDTAKMEAGKMRLEYRQLFAHKLLEDCLERVRLQAEAKEIVLEMQAPADLDFRADEPLFCRVLVNLLVNAVRHSPIREKIQVAARGNGDSGTIEFSVTNFGVAIPPEIQGKLFEKFFQAEAGSASGGAGLGLHFCRMVTEAHGGSITVVSPLPGQVNGSSFVVKLPRAAAEKP